MNLNFKNSDIINLINTGKLEEAQVKIGELLIYKPNDIFLDTSIAHFMGDADHNKLHDLIATAQAEQLTSWYSATSGARFEFISQKIFVNPKGQGCRDYQIKVMRGFVTYPSFNYTACRDSEGVWQVVSH